LFIIPACLSFILFGFVYFLEHHKEINSIKTDKASIEKKLKDLEDSIERLRISASMVFKK